jgi:hypothetical protein
VGGALARPAGQALRACYAHPFKQSLKLGAAVALAGGYDHREWPALAFAGEVQLGREASFAAPQCLILGVQEPLFSSRSLGSRLAPAAC